MDAAPAERGDRPSPNDVDAAVRALHERRAFVRPSLRAVAAGGADASTWLNDLLTAAVDDLKRAASVRSLLLSPTGRIRADVHVLRSGDAYVLAQSLDQPEPVDRLLAPYILSSDVRIARADVSPVLVPGDDGWHAALEPPPGATQVDEAAGEGWRIDSGVAAFPVDLDVESLPAEAGLDVPPVTDTAKGCFLGQESVARVRNLGHPTRLVLAFEADGPAAAGDAVILGDGLLAEDRPVGVITSAWRRTDASTAVIARVRWESREADVRTQAGVALRRR